MKVYIETYGCSANFSDSEIMSGLLESKGHELVDSEKKADAVILNSCYVKDPTERKMKKRIKKLKNKKLIVAGCFPESDRKGIEEIAPNASLIGPRNIQDIVQVVESEEKMVKLGGPGVEKSKLEKKRKNPLINIVQINEGCLCECSFCITKHSRGKLQSYSIGAIVNDIKKSIEEGCKEIWLTSQDTGAYGLDFNRNLAELLSKVSEIEGDFKTRIGMMNPIHAIRILPDLIGAYKSEKIFKFLHLPIQSGSDRVLDKMKRGNSVKQFETIVEKFREKFPKLTLSTDIIVGFPGETESDFQKTLDLIERVKPDIVNISRYGARPGTEASELEQISGWKKKERSRKLTKLVKKIGLEKNKKWVDWTGEILIDEEGKTGSWIGRNFAYRPIVVKNKENLFGKELKVKIKKAKPTYLISEILD
ncbi:MAG: tRNA (N(6)-L-threonylcarbamoyladenosine(37)-C(2))-methylthiotransferase [Candidatus Undinarchaeales archaeon]